MYIIVFKVYYNHKYIMFQSELCDSNILDEMNDMLKTLKDVCEKYYPVWLLIDLLDKLSKPNFATFDKFLVTPITKVFRFAKLSEQN